MKVSSCVALASAIASSPWRTVFFRDRLALIEMMAVSKAQGISEMIRNQSSNWVGDGDPRQWSQSLSQVHGWLHLNDLRIDCMTFIGRSELAACCSRNVSPIQRNGTWNARCHLPACLARYRD